MHLISNCESLNWKSKTELSNKTKIFFKFNTIWGNTYDYTVLKNDNYVNTNVLTDKNIY